MVAEITESFALDNHASPSILFRVKLDFQESAEVITTVSGKLSTQDGVVVSYLFEEYLNRSAEAPARLTAKGTVFDQQYFKPAKYLTSLVGELNEHSLKRIDDSRVKDPKRDVKLKLEISVKMLESVALIDQLREVEPKTLIPGKVLTVPRYQGGESQANIIVRGWYDNNFQSDKNSGWNLSGNGNPTFLQFKVVKAEIPHRIPATDWISDYAPKFGLGHHIVVEMPSKDGPLYRETSAYLTKAEEAFGRWDTKGVFSNCREIGTLLDRAVKDKYGKDSFAYGEKWGRAFARFSDWASFDLHLEDLKKKYKPDDVRTDRPDSESLLLSTKILIKYAQEVGV